MILSDFYKRIFVIHWKPLVERREYLTSKFKEYNLEDRVEWVDQYETEDDVKGIKNPFNIHKRILAINQSHLYCYKKQIEKGYDNILILEDDIDFEFLNVVEYLNICAKEFVDLDGDVAFLGSCCELKVKNPKPPQILYYDPSYGSRCTGAYIVNIRCSDKLYKAGSLNCHAIDRVLDGLIPLLSIRCLWSGLPIRQGSETGKYSSSVIDIRDKNGNYPS